MISIQSSFISVVGLFCGIVYLVHFNFAWKLLKIIYVIILIAYPVICFSVHAVVANNLRHDIL